MGVEREYQHENFPNPPITEALVDIRVEFEKPIQNSVLQKLSEEYIAAFPIQQDRTEFKHQFEVKEAHVKTSTDNNWVGKILFTENKDKALQFRVNGFTFSKLKPYESWAKLRDEAQIYWGRYKEITGPSKLVRLAVRNINRIEIPMPFTDFFDYIKTGLKMSEGIPQGLSEFFFRAVIPNPEDDKAQAIIISTMEAITSESKFLPYIFDIDVFKHFDTSINEETIWGELEKIQEFKNLIFFNSITKNTRELFR